ncbi:MAG: PAS domain S-box protein [Methanoregulaceae archaeon]|nr:PAS domain S-box protein [Methanoregulaceae archaeon]
MALISPEGRWIRANQSICEIVGYSEDELQGMTFQDITHPDDLDTDLEYVRQMIAGEIRTYQMEKRYFHKLGYIIWVLLSVSLVRDNHGKPRYFISQIENITSRKRAEDALKESEERLSQITENSPVVYYVHDRALNRFIYVSPAYEKIWGRPCQELYDNPYSFLEAIYPDDMCSVQEAIRMELEKGKYFDREYRIIQPDGEIRWVHSRNFPVLDIQGTVYRVIGIAEDITGRKLAENALRENEEKYRTIFDNAIVGVYQTTPNGRFISANMAFARMYGYANPGELLAKLDNVAVQMYADANTRTEVLRILKERGLIDSYEMPVRRKDGSVFWISLTTRMVKDQEGTLLWYEGTQVDITSRKLAEDALKENEEKLALVMDGVPILIAYVDTDLRFIYMNKAYADWYGQSREELIGKHVADLLEKDVFERALPSYQAALRGEVVSLENNVRDLEGKERFVTVRLIPHFIGKQVSGFFATVMDITSRKLAEQSLAESEAKFRTMVEASPDMIWEIDTHGNFTYISPQCRVQLGYEPGELIGQPFFSLIRPESVSTIRTAFLEHVQDKRSYSMLAVSAHDKKGNQITIEIRSVPVLGSEGQLTGFRGIASDITESVLMHNTLKESEHFVQRILDTTPNLVYIFDIQDHRNIYTNREVANYLGYSSEEILSMGARLFEIILHPDDAERVARHYATLGKAKEGEVLELEYRVKNADGRWRWFHSRDTVFARDEEGNVRQILGITDDITDKKNATDTILETNAYTRSLIEAAIDPLVTITKDGTIGDVNAATEHATGYTRAELVGTDFSEYFTKPEKARAGYRQVFESGTVKDYPLEIRHRDGHTIPVLYNATVFKDSTGSVQGVFAAARDITNLKVAEEALRYSELKYRDLAELMPQTIFEIDLNGRFTYANRFALNLFGYDSSELEKGLDISQMVIPDDVNRAKQNLAGIAQGINKSGTEYRFLLKNGGTFTGITYLSVIEKNGKPVGFRGIIADISERKHNEDILRLSHTLLECANQQLELPAFLQECVQVIKDYTGCEAVGIRLLDPQGNIPYQAYIGFSEGFYSPESPLSINSDECMCTYVIRGTTDPSQPFFTRNGSFYMNGTTKFLATVSDEAKGRTRNVCNQTGYESVALVPIRQGERIAGLIHLADRRENHVPLATVQVIEKITDTLCSSIQRVSAERKVRESLTEKEVLLREIHHRVKNNLARVISLIGLQKAQLSDPGDIARFTDLEARIRSMSLVHESLYQSHSLSRINVQMYVEDLVRQLIQSYGPKPDIRWDIRLGDIALPIDTAIHCGLIITEIVTNSIKYAFPGGGPCNMEEGGCTISISMKEKDGFITLNASDNGRGIPKGTILSGPGSLGLTLIGILVKNQLHGDLEMDTTRGTSFIIRFVREPDTKGELYAG